MIVEKGTHEELMVLDQTYAKLWNMQIKNSLGTTIASRSASISNFDNKT